MASRRYISSVSRLIDKAVQHGATRQTQSRWHWTIDPKCQKPSVIEYHARPSPDRVTGGRKILVKRHFAHPLIIVVEAPCRKCRHCERKRAAMWRERAKIEVQQAHRTWLCTYTLNPDEHYKMRARAMEALRKRSVDIEALTGEEVFAAVNRQAALQLTLMLKRLRKNTGRELRYILVTERHKSGLPHWHMLIHEQKGPITYRQLAAEWTLGFTKFNLLKDLESAGYVAKYLGKSMQARVRASVRYGQR